MKLTARTYYAAIAAATVITILVGACIMALLFTNRTVPTEMSVAFSTSVAALGGLVMIPVKEAEEEAAKKGESEKSAAQKNEPQGETNSDDQETGGS